MIEILNNDLKFLIPEIFLITCILGLLMFGVLLTKENNSDKQLMIVKLAIITLIGYLILLFNNPFPSQIILFNLLYLNSFNYLVKIIIVISTIILFFMSYDYIKNEDVKSYELTILILLSVLGMIFLISSYDLLSLYLAIELQSLAFYILAAFKRNTIASTEAGLKYFILGALSSGILLLGIVIVYGLTGTTNFEYFYNLNESNMNTGLIIAFDCIAIALFFKLAAAPFHMWAPDVYEGAPTIITALFAAISKLPILALFIQLFNGYLVNFYPFISHIVILVAVASMFVGSISALGQLNIKRLLAYSSILNVGYMLLGLSLGNTEGVKMTMLFVIVYMIVSLNLFSFLLSLRTQNNKLIKNINDLAGLSKTYPLLAFNVSMSLFSLVGVPPLAGFLSKYFLLTAIMNSAWPLLAVIVVLTSVIASVYYLRIIKIMYFDVPAKIIELKPIQYNLGVVLSITNFLILVLIFNPNLIMNLIEISLNF